MLIPVWPKEPGEDVGAFERWGSILFSHSATFMLLHGRATVFRALAAHYGDQDPADAVGLVRVANGRVDAEKHPRVIAEMLLYLRSAFTVKEAIPEASDTFRCAVANCPDAFAHDATLHLLAFVSGYVKPAAYYEGWLDQLLARPDDRAQQAFGELLFLYYARRRTPWADKRITSSIASGSPRVLAGMSYGAAEAFPYPHCRLRATDILCATVSSGEPEIVKIASRALVPLHDKTFTLDAEARRLIQAILDHPLAVKELGPQLIETVSTHTGSDPTFVLNLTTAVLVDHRSSIVG